jgi:hypothetical protein
VLQVEAVMSKRKTRCCSSCGRLTKGHLGIAGKKCRMTELLAEQENFGEKTTPVKKGENKGGKQGGKAGGPDDWEDVTSTASSLDSPSVELEDKVDRLSTKVDVLTDALAKLLDSGIVPGVISAGKRKVKLSDGGVNAAGGHKGKSTKSGGELLVKAVASSSHRVSGEGDVNGAVSLPTTRSLARDRELNKLLDVYDRDDRDLMSALESSKSKSLVHGEIHKLKKHLSIPDHLSRLTGVPVSLEDELLTSSGVNITFKSTAKKVEIEDVTPGMWISANSRILDLLSSAMSNVEVAEYHEYTRQVGDLLQVYTESSVMLFDDEHRRMVHATNRSWIDVYSHLERIFLKFKSNPVPSPKASSSGASGSSKPVERSKTVSKRSNNPCFAFNAKSGCKVAESSCSYKHVCSYRAESGMCRESHPKHEHIKFHPGT